MGRWHLVDCVNDAPSDSARARTHTESRRIGTMGYCSTSARRPMRQVLGDSTAAVHRPRAGMARYSPLQSPTNLPFPLKIELRDPKCVVAREVHPELDSEAR